MSVQSPHPFVHRRVDEMPSARCVTMSTPSVVCDDFSAGSTFHFDAHAHPTLHICFVLRGVLAERDGTARRRMAAGSARVSPAGDQHELSIEGLADIRCLVVSIDRHQLDASPSPPVGRRYVQGPGVERLAGLLREEMRELDDASPISLEMLGLEAATLGTHSGGRAVGPPPWLERVRDRVRDDLRTMPTLKELARDAGVSRATLARTFRASFGYTIGQYARGQRVEAARRLLLRTDKPLPAVAYEAGFADQSHMTRQVAARLGMPPGRLRARRGVRL